MKPSSAKSAPITRRWPCRRTIAMAALGALIADQVSKLLILHTAPQWTPGIEVTGFFNIVLTYNRGVSFSLLHMDARSGPWILAALALGIVGILIFWLRKVTHRVPALGGGLVVGGAIGNVVDRLYLGAVVDFLDLHGWGYHWPAFNIADMAISLGVALILFDGLFPGRTRGK